MAQDLPALHRRLSAWPAGQWLFSRMVCARAPYFGTIAPRITVLEAGRCEGHINDRRAVHNHLGTVHAIALCNLAELVMGLLVDAATGQVSATYEYGPFGEVLRATGPEEAGGSTQPIWPSRRRYTILIRSLPAFLNTTTGAPVRSSSATASSRSPSRSTPSSRRTR